MRRQGSVLAAAVALVPFGNYRSPIFLTSPPGDTSRVFVVERAGTIQVSDQGTNHQFLDISSTVATDGERGLLSMAFAPDYATSGLFYVFDVDKTTDDVKIEEFKRSSTDPDAADPASRRVIFDRPHSASNHNGGQLQFGPGGYLFATIGDNATSSNAQSVTNVYGKLLRLDPQTGQGPADNPFVGQGGDSSLIWSLGLRNPWRFSFDSQNQDLVIGDVGASSWEEIDWATSASGYGRKLNFGWPTCEGFCNTSPYTDPVLAYDHSNGNCAITGGYVSHAPDLASLAGRYVYGDYCGGGIRSAVLAQPQVTDDRSEGLMVTNLFSFGQDACGHLYALSGDGPVYRLSEQSPPPDCPPPPQPQPEPQPQPQPTPGGPVATPPPPDTTAPTLYVSFRRRQRAARTLMVVVGASCNEACKVHASGVVAGTGARRPLRLRAAGASDGQRPSMHRLVLRLNRRSAAGVARALRRHRRVLARVRVTAADAAANTARPQSVTVRIAR